MKTLKYNRMSLINKHTKTQHYAKIRSEQSWKLFFQGLAYAEIYGRYRHADMENRRLQQPYIQKIY